LKPAASPNGPRGWIVLLFLLSGLTALIYEIVWMKMLVLVVGNTVYSTTTVLAAFMGGLALGSFTAGRYLEKLGNPLRLYGILEGLIGLYALLTPFLIAAAYPLFRFLLQGADPSSYTFSVVRLLVCGLILLVPTTLMGATLPVLCQFFAGSENNLGWTVGKLYGINTLGAVLGASGAGFVLIPTLGMRFTLVIAAAINLAIAGAVYTLSRRATAVEPAEEKSADKKRRKKKSKKSEAEAVSTISGSRVFVSALATIGLAGAASMIYQIAWTRVLALVIGSSVYAFSLIVTAFVAGLALGALAAGRIIDRRKNLALGLATVQWLVGIAALLMLPLLGKLPPYIASLLMETTLSFERLHAMEFGLIFLLMLVPTLLMGAAFPMATKICAKEVEHFGKLVGNVYAVNTLGAILGTVLGGFVLIPWLGTQTAILVAALVNMCAGSIVLLGANGVSVRRLVPVAAAYAATALIWWQIPSWDSVLLTSGPYIYAERYHDVAVQKGIAMEEAMRDGREIVFYEEGLHATVSVERSASGDLALQVNGKADASAQGDAMTQLMLGHLPLFLHEDPKDVLVVGLGSGMTLDAATRHDTTRVDIVELEPAVVRANVWFEPFTNDALKDPRVHLHVTDGRNYLAFTDREYDVIISEPSNPWVAGMANLFTIEFFELTKTRLRDGGVFCQWLHAYSMTSSDFRTIVATFQSAFPQMSLWELDLGGDYILIGFKDGITLPYDTLRERITNPKINTHLKTMNLRNVASLLGRLVLVNESAAAYARDAVLHTDDNALLEYSAPKGFFQDERRALVVELYEHRPDATAALAAFGWEDAPDDEKATLKRYNEARYSILEGYKHILNNDGVRAIEAMTRALESNPRDHEGVDLLHQLHYETALAYEEAGRLEDALASFAKSVEVIENFMAGDRELLANQFELNVAYARAQLKLGMMSLDANELGTAVEALRIASEVGVDNAETHNNLGAVYEKLGRLDEALAEFETAIEMKPHYVAAHVNHANVNLRLGHHEEAIAGYRRAQELRPNYEMTHYNLGVAYFQAAEWAKAADEWRRALELKPDFREAKKSLDAALAQLKGHELSSSATAREAQPD